MALLLFEEDSIYAVQDFYFSGGGGTQYINLPSLSIPTTQANRNSQIVILNTDSSNSINITFKPYTGSSDPITLTLPAGNMFMLPCVAGDASGNINISAGSSATARAIIIAPHS